jgi:hypothetical protein
MEDARLQEMRALVDLATAVTAEMQAAIAVAREALATGNTLQAEAAIQQVSQLSDQIGGLNQEWRALVWY